MSLDLSRKHCYQTGFSLIEVMVGMTIGFIAMVVIVQTLSVFETHKRTTTAAADAQENGLLAMMAIEEDIRKAGSGFNHPATFSCQNFFSYYQAISGTGAPVSVGPFATTLPVLIEDGAGNSPDTIHVRSGLRFTGSVPTSLSSKMNIAPATAESVELEVDRAFDFIGEPVAATDPPSADLIMVVHPDSLYCSLMRVSSKTGKVLTITNGPAGKTDEYNPPQAFMTANNWPGFGTKAGLEYPESSLVFRVGDKDAGGIRSASYSVNANASLQAVITNSGAASSTEILASEIVALQAQYGVSASKDNKTISSWENATGATWGMAALLANTANQQRVKAIRVAVVARSSKRDGALVTSACADNHAVNFGPCSWTDDTAANPAPVIDLRVAVGDTEWQHYRYKVYQTVIPMRNVLWPNL
jgi:type IV pilus assembly protein PilW